MIKVVLDTDVLVAAFLSPDGASRVWLELLLTGKVTLACSVPLFFEYEAVLKRPEHLAETGLGEKDIEIFLAGLASVIEPVSLDYLYRPSLRDANDEMVLETAINGQVEHLLTFNLRHLEREGKRHGITVQTPGSALKDWRMNNE